uniref:Uncharacterized protein n=1 Tax=Tanacetum cinerariifolium TaxID=118510 RepID=A0A6L2LRA1_TANCI|nr:hypothetical protein [Tanacetum cinerariifolium]
MDIIIDQQVALDDDLVPHASRLRIDKSKFRLRSDLKSKESTLQVVYDVLKLTPFYKAFLVTADVPEIYMQEFWATAIFHHHSIRFKMNNKKHIVNLEYFRDMLQICPRIPNQQFDELPFEEAILTFLKELGHSVINKCLSGKSTGYDSLRLSQAQILWGMYHKKNVYFAYLLWEDFVYQVEHKDAKKSNEMYYPRFTKVIVNFFITKDQSIPRRNKVNWHFAWVDHMFTTIKLVSRHQNTQQYGAILPIELTNEAIKNSESYKEYYAIASGAEPAKTKPSVRKKQSSSETIMPPPTAKGKRLKTSAKVDKPAKEKQPAKTSKAKDDDDDQNNDDDVKTDSDNDGDDFIHPKFSTHDDEDKEEKSFDPIVQSPSHDENIDDEDSHGMNVEGDEMDDEGANEEDDANELYKDSSSVSSRFVSNMLNPSPDTGIDSIFNLNNESTPRVDVPVTTTVEIPLLSATTLPPPPTPIIPTLHQTPVPSPTNVPSSSLQDLPNFGYLFGFDHRLKALEINFSEFMRANQFAEAISSIHGIVDKYLDHQMNKAVKVAVELQSDRLRDEAQAENEDFLNKLDENI